jgi:hypothetical protein
MMVAVAVVASSLGIAVVVRDRAASFRRLAAYHDQAGTSLLVEQAGGPIACSTGLSERDVEGVYASRGPSAWGALLAARYHWALADKYRWASRHAYLPVRPDPPPLPGCYPDFQFNADLAAIDDEEGFR